MVYWLNPPETYLISPDRGYPSHELTNPEHSPEELRLSKKHLMKVFLKGMKQIESLFERLVFCLTET